MIQTPQSIGVSMTRAYFLFVRPSFLEGAARLFDFGNALTSYNYSRAERDADDRAMRQDWLAVGDDLTAAMRTLDRQSAETPATR